MYLTGMVDKRTLEKYEKEAKEKNRETWYLSWALDTNLEGQSPLRQGQSPPRAKVSEPARPCEVCWMVCPLALCRSQ